MMFLNFQYAFYQKGDILGLSRYLKPKVNAIDLRMDTMKIIKGKALYTAEQFDSIIAMLRNRAKKYANNPAYMFRRKPNAEVMIRTYQDLITDIDSTGTALLARGFKGEHIAVMGENSYEWAVAYNAACSGVGVIVPLDRMLPENEVISLIDRSRSSCLFITPKLLPIAEAAAKTNDTLRLIVVMDQVVPDNKAVELPADERYILYSDLMTEGSNLVIDGDRSFIDAKIDPDVMAIILFTSGTTAASKGVMLSHRNIVNNLYGIASALELYPGERALSVLPLHHTFETTTGMYAMLYFGVCICFMDGLRYLANNLVEWKINCMVGVPLLFENIYKRVDGKIEESGKKQLVNVMRPIARNLKAVGFQFNRKMFKSVIDGLGGGLRIVVSGAAAMDKEIFQAFNDFGLTFLEGYGLTEHSPVVSVHNPRLLIPGSVGVPLYGVEVAINTNSSEAQAVGEILVRSDSVMLGYYEDQEATKEAIDEEGWLHTGDMGYIDAKGCIHITGRIKSMIVLTNGKKAFPEEIETLLNKIAGVKESIVWGETNARDAVDICVKILLDREALPIEKKADDQAAAEYLKKEIAKVNTQMPGYRSVHYFVFTEVDYVRTTTMKVKRQDENRLIHSLLDRLNLSMRELNGKNLDTLPES